MKILKQIINFIGSLKTALWLIVILIALLFAGAFVMPLNKAFEEIHSMPMLQWLKLQSPSVSWWLWGAIAVTAMLGVNTVLCSIESIVKKRTAVQWLLIISPQIIHAGFLFILLAHLISADGGYKGYGIVGQDTTVEIDADINNSFTLKTKNISISHDSKGNIKDWTIEIDFLAGSKTAKSAVIKPNSPAFYNGFGVYGQRVVTYPYDAAIIEISKEPGAVWAFIGGVLFTAGTIMLLALKMKRLPY